MNLVERQYWIDKLGAEFDRWCLGEPNPEIDNCSCEERKGE